MTTSDIKEIAEKIEKEKTELEIPNLIQDWFKEEGSPFDNSDKEKVNKRIIQRYLEALRRYRGV